MHIKRDIYAYIYIYREHINTCIFHIEREQQALSIYLHIEDDIYISLHIERFLHIERLHIHFSI